MATIASPIRCSGESGFLRQHRLDCALLCAAGAGRAENEDQFVLAAPGGEAIEAAAMGYLFAVIDGDSDADNGRSAAREIATSLLEVVDDPRRLEVRPDLLLYRLQDANDRCHEFLEGRAAATAVWIWEEPGSGGLTAAWAHVGDTRLYHLGRNGWRQLTRDHAKGRLLDRAVGQGPGLMVDTGTITLRPEERLLLASDGVWRNAPPGSVVSGPVLPTAAESVRRLVGTARLNGSRGDTTALAIHARSIDADPEPEH